MSDKFLEEVEGRIRSDRYREIMTGALPLAIGAVVLVVILMLGIWGWQSWQHKRTSKASEAFAAAILAGQGGDTAGAEKQFAEVVKSGPAVYKSLALQAQAGLRLKQDKTAEAVALFDQAAKADHDPLLADAARLKSALALMDTAPYARVEAILNPLLDKKRPYWIAAREALAMAKLKAGMNASARTDFRVLGASLETPESMRQRAQYAVALIDSGGADIPAILKAAPVMPAMPTPPQAPGGAGGDPAGQAGQPGAAQ